MTEYDPYFEPEYDDGYYGDGDIYDEEELIDGVGFANPGSALRAETEDNPRNLPCPDQLTPLDRARGYICDSCADAAEQGRDITYYEGGADEED